MSDAVNFLCSCAMLLNIEPLSYITRTSVSVRSSDRIFDRFYLSRMKRSSKKISYEDISDKLFLIGYVGNVIDI